MRKSCLIEDVALQDLTSFFCAEISWTDRADQRAEDAGYIALRSMAGKDSILCSRFRSIAKSTAIIQGRWSINLQ